MKTRRTVGAALFLLLIAPAFAHRLDEYLQATMISLERERVQVLMRLVPGVAVSGRVLAMIDTDGDGAISKAEQHAYAALVLHDVSLAIDGKNLAPRLVAASFPETSLIKEGLGEIRLTFEAKLPDGGHRRLTFENHHQSSVASYMANCLVPGDRSIQVIAQARNERQSLYQLEYVQSRSVGDWFSLTPH